MRTMTKISLTQICIFFVSMGLLGILLSEETFYLHLSDTGFISGAKKTFAFAWILLWSLFEIMQNRGKLNKTYKVFSAFTLVTLISTAIGVAQDISIPRQMIHITVFFSVFTAFYVGAKKLGKETPIKLLKFMYLITALIYIYGKLVNRNSDISANTVYYVLMFLPITSFIKTVPIRYAACIFQILAVLQSNKRTALIAILVYFAFVKLRTEQNAGASKMALKYAACSIGLVVIWIAFPYITSALNVTVFDELSAASIKQDGGSNRLYIYGQLWDVQKNSGLLHWLIGDGYNSVLMSKICTDGVLGENVSAHNDFLEVLYDYGLTGIALYVSFFLNFVRNGKKSVSKYRIQFFGSILVVLVISMTSHLVIYLNYYAVMFAFWGICLSEFDKAPVQN